YYIFYQQGGLKIAQCTYEGAIEVIDTKNAEDVHITNPFDSHVKFDMKRFTHNVNGTTQDLYFIFTSLRLAGQFSGWRNFAINNPTFPLVTNNANTKITMTPQVIADLNSINYAVNHAHSYIPDYPNDNWRILGEGESGDCEDFALTKAQALLDLGYPASAIHIEVGVISSSSAHAWLVVQTTSGDYALDTSRDTIVLNASLVPSGGGSFYARKRQIGMNWASISPFAWLESATNDDEYFYLYILDPLLNIIYAMFYVSSIEYTDWGGDFVVPLSVNFSEDNNSIYICYNISSDTSVRYELNLNENKVNIVSVTPGDFGYVKRDGTLWPIPPIIGFWARNCGVFSHDGYYEYFYHLPYTLQFWYATWILKKTESSESFSIWVEGGLFSQQSPFGELRTGEYLLPESWIEIEARNELIQSFVWGDGSKRLYKNGASCLGEVIAAVGTTEANLVGLFYIPSTNRLTG
ncbi:MAG: transglutaminase-like cysteine peptidase, partial [Dehalococcoidales bacterium]|nr:transglutaminase-like cysteine peptidase [Dehalococcoidales bacterium]